MNNFKFRYKEYFVSPRARKITVPGNEMFCAEFVMVRIGDDSRVEVFGTEKSFDNETEALNCAKQCAIDYIDELLP